MQDVRIRISRFSCVLSASKSTGELGITKNLKAVTVIKSAAAVITFNVGKTRPNFKGMRQIARARTRELFLPAYKSGKLIENEPISRAEAVPRTCLRYFHVCTPLPSQPNLYQRQTTHPHSPRPLALTDVRSTMGMLQGTIQATSHRGRAAALFEVRHWPPRRSNRPTPLN